MSERRPRFVAVGPAGAVLRRSQASLAAVTAAGLLVLIASPGWWPLVLVPFVVAPVLYAVRLGKSTMLFTATDVKVRTVVRQTVIPVSDVAMVVVSARPGVAYVRARDGGSAVVSTSAVAVEFANEKRLRLHTLEMLGRLYADTDIALLNENTLGYATTNRSSATVRFRYLAPTWREVAIVGAGTLLAVAAVLI